MRAMAIVVDHTQSTRQEQCIIGFDARTIWSVRPDASIDPGCALQINDRRLQPQPVTNGGIGFLGESNRILVLNGCRESPDLWFPLDEVRTQIETSPVAEHCVMPRCDAKARFLGTRSQIDEHRLTSNVVQRGIRKEPRAVETHAIEHDIALGQHRIAKCLNRSVLEVNTC